MSNLSVKFEETGRKGHYFTPRGVKRWNLSNSEDRRPLTER